MQRIPRAITALGVALAVAATALAQSPAPKADSTKAKSTSLAAYIPKDKLIAYVEFQGTAAHADAWAKSAASKVLNDTPTGAMLEDLLTQLVTLPYNKAPVAERRITPAEIVAVLKHAAGAGVVVGINTKPGAAPKVAGTLVFPGAMRDDASKKTFAALVRILTPPGGKAVPADKPGNRRIIVVSNAGGDVLTNFWVENKTDLVLTEDPDAVIAALDKPALSAAEHPTRLALLKGQDGEEPLGFGWVEKSELPPGSPLSAPLNANPYTAAIKSASYRLTLRGENLVHDLRVVIPSPRPAALALLDSAKFDLKTMPSLPDGVVEFSALAIEPAKLYAQVLALAKETNPGSEAIFAKLEASVKSKSKLRLREDVLGRLGPKIVAYTSPSKSTKSAEGPSGLLAAISGGGFQVPKGAILIEMKDPKAVSTMLDALVIAANKEIRAYMAPPVADDPGRPGARPKSGGTAQATPEFRPGVTNPKTYNLILPTALGAMTNLRLSIVVGKKYLVIATMPDASKEALAAEAKSPPRALSGDVAKVVEGLPSGLVVLEVSDPRDTLPEGLVNLPATLTAALAPAAAPPPSPPPAAAATAKAAPPGGRAGRGKPRAEERPSVGAVGVAATPGGAVGVAATPGGAVGVAATPGGAVEAAKPGNAPAGAAPTPAPPAATTFRVDPAKTPSAEAIRPLIGPTAAALFADDQEIRLIIRHSFPDLGMLASLPTTIQGLTGSAKALGSGGLPPGMAPPVNAPRGAVPPPPGGQPKPPPGNSID